VTGRSGSTLLVSPSLLVALVTVTLDLDGSVTFRDAGRPTPLNRSRQGSEYDDQDSKEIRSVSVAHGRDKRGARAA